MSPLLRDDRTDRCHARAAPPRDLGIAKDTAAGAPAHLVVAGCAIHPRRSDRDRCPGNSHHSDTASRDPTAAPNLTTGRQSLQPAPATRISAERRDNTVTVTWASIARPTSTDWFGIYRVGDPDTAYQDWAYVSCTKAPDQARASGSCSLPAPAGTGAYDIRLFTNNGYTRLARSEQVASSLAAGGQVGLKVSADVADLRSVVNVQWQAIDGATATDWIGLYRSGAADTAHMTWLYVGCAQLPLDARPRGSCNV